MGVLELLMKTKLVFSAWENILFVTTEIMVEDVTVRSNGYYLMVRRHDDRKYKIV